MSKGSYVIIFYLDSEMKSIEIGKLGYIPFKRGYYYYVGSAMGSSNSSVSLLNRVKRHIISNDHANKFERKPKIHWHIDYILNDEHIKLKNIYLIPSKYKNECEIAELLKNMTEDCVLKFGCSDCNCKSHLFFNPSMLS